MTPQDEGGQRPLSAIYEEHSKSWTARRRSDIANEIARLQPYRVAFEGAVAG